MTVHVLRNPKQFDVIVAENMFGDILSDLTAEICGSLGIAGSINASDAHAMAQAAHGSAPDIAGRNIANPAALMLSTAQLLGWLSQRHSDKRLSHAAHRIESAVELEIAAGHCTQDLGGELGTDAFGAAVASRIRGAR